MTEVPLPILVLNGPNLNMLGVRQPQHYGHDTLDDVMALCEKTAARAGRTVEFFQSNSEGAAIDRIHQARGTTSGIVINPGDGPTPRWLCVMPWSFPRFPSSRSTSPTCTPANHFAITPTSPPSLRR
jgi:hypothetical protein